jgi:uncharacterized protein
MDEPAFRVYLCDKTAVEIYPDDVPGHWIAEEVWPSPHINPATLFLNPDGLSSKSGEEKPLTYRGDKIVGTLRGEPDAFFFPTDLPQEQTADDQNSLVFDSQPLMSDLEVVGNPLLKIRLSADVSVANLAVRLEQITPEGKSWAFTMGLLNLTHRDSHEHPSALEPGRLYDIEVPLTFASMRLTAGNRLRLALSENFWPLVWPAPRIATLTLITGISSLILPVRTPRTLEDAPRSAIMRNKTRAPVPVDEKGDLKVRRTGPDENGLVRIEKHFVPRAVIAPDIGTVITRGWTPAVLEMQAGMPTSCKWAGGFTSSYQRGEWNVSIHGGVEMTCTEESFRVKEFIRATEDNLTIFERHWDHAIKRDLM